MARKILKQTEIQDAKALLACFSKVLNLRQYVSSFLQLNFILYSFKAVRKKRVFLRIKAGNSLLNENST